MAELFVEGATRGIRVTALIAALRSPELQNPPGAPESDRAAGRAKERAERAWRAHRPAGAGPPRFSIVRNSWIACCWAALLCVVAIAVAACPGAGRAARCGGPPACAACRLRISLFFARWLQRSEALFGGPPTAADFGGAPPGERWAAEAGARWRCKAVELFNTEGPSACMTDCITSAHTAGIRPFLCSLLHRLHVDLQLGGPAGPAVLTHQDEIVAHGQFVCWGEWGSRVCFMVWAQEGCAACWGVYVGWTV
jgi:hypothetical protein